MTYKGQVILRYQGWSAKLQFSWPKSTLFFVNAFLLIVNDQSERKSYYQIFDFSRRYNTFDIPFSNLHHNLDVTIYGLKRFVDAVNGGWFFVIKTFGQTIIKSDSTRMEITLVLTSSAQDQFPKLKEAKTFQVDNVYHPPSNYSLVLLLPSKPRGESALIFLEGLIQHGMRPEYEKVVFIHPGGDIFYIPFPLEAATNYTVRVKWGTFTRNGGVLVTASAHVSFLTYMTKVELNELFQKAVNHVSQSEDKVTILTHFYRTKPKRYFDDIRIKGYGVMKKYIKNLGGDPASSLNRNIRGLFFSAHLDASTLAPPPHSPYGDQRLHISVPLLMNMGTNLYFADFYCHISNHRVTLVITHRYSASDFFCQQRLIQLNVLCNPFLTIPLSGEYAKVTMGVKVEVFYTEDVDIGNLIWRFPSSVFFTRVKMNKDNNFNRAVLITSIGFSKKDGCTVCNLKKHLKSRK